MASAIEDKLEDVLNALKQVKTLLAGWDSDRDADTHDYTMTQLQEMLVTAEEMQNDIKASIDAMEEEDEEEDDSDE